MKVLIVDAFSRSHTGRAAFRNFEGAVRSSFKKLEVQEEGGTQFIVRHFDKGIEVQQYPCNFFVEDGMSAAGCEGEDLAADLVLIQTHT